jgi:hypothetical protein
MQFRPHQRFGMAGGLQYQYFQQRMASFIEASGAVHHFTDMSGHAWVVRPGGLALDYGIFLYF